MRNRQCRVRLRYIKYHRAAHLDMKESLAGDRQDLETNQSRQRSDKVYITKKKYLGLVKQVIV